MHILSPPPTPPILYQNIKTHPHVLHFVVLRFNLLIQILITRLSPFPFYTVCLLDLFFNPASFACCQMATQARRALLTATSSSVHQYK